MMATSWLLLRVAIASNCGNTATGSSSSIWRSTPFLVLVCLRQTNKVPEPQTTRTTRDRSASHAYSSTDFPAQI